MAFARKTKQEYASATGADQALYLRAGLKHSQTAFAHLLFCYCVNEYKAQATKKKAIYIWDRFLAGIGAIGTDFSDPNKLDLNVDECGKPEVMPPIKMWIETLKKMRQQALGTNRLVRFFTSSDRTAPSNLFDEFVEAMIARTGDTVWGDIAQRLHNDTVEVAMIYNKLLAKMPALKAELIGAGFTVVATRIPIGAG